MSEFEQFTSNWYFENVSTFALDTGLFADFFRELNLKGITKKLFLKACNILYRFQKSIEKEMIEEEIEKRKNK